MGEDPDWVEIDYERLRLHNVGNRYELKDVDSVADLEELLKWCVNACCFFTRSIRIFLHFSKTSDILKKIIKEGKRLFQ